MSGVPFAPEPAAKAEHASKIPEPARPDAAPAGSLEGSSFWGRGSFYRELAVQLIFLAAYILLDRASIEFRLWTGTPAWYLPAGLSLAILLCGGMRYLPIVIVSGVTVSALSHHPILSLAGIPRNIVVSVCYAGGAVWLRRVWRLDLGLRRLPDVGGLALFLVAVKFPAALFSILTFLADGLVSRRDFWKATFNWWVGDSISITSLTPFLLVFVTPWVGDFLQGRRSGESSGGGSRRGLAPSEVLERATELASALAALWLVFGFKPAVPYQPLYLLFFPVIWMAVRHGLGRASLAVLAINLGVIVAAQVTPPEPEGMPRRQLVMLALALTGLCVGAVVSERRQAEAALQQKSQELDSFFNVSVDLLCIATIDGYFLRLNPAWETTLGYARDELKAKRFFDFVHSDDVEATREATAALARQQKVVDFANRYRRQDGEFRWLEWRAAAAGKLIYAAARDVTEQRNAEETLRRRERELKEAQRLAQVGSWEWDISSDTTLWSDELYRITDRHPDLPPPTNEELQQLYHGENWERLHAAMQNALGTGAPYNVELERTQPDGTRRWIMAHGEAVRSASGQVVGLRGTAQDITERKRAEEALRRSQEELQSVLASIPDYLWSAEIDSQGHFTYRYYSPVVEKITGRPPEFYLPGPERWRSTIHPDDRPRIRSVLEALRTGQSPLATDEYRIIRPDGTVRWVRDSVQVRRGDGSIRIDGVVSDITGRKTAELDLRDREERFRKVFEEGPLGMSIIGLDGTLLRANTTICAMYGYTEEELRRLKVSDFTHPDDIARHLELTGQALRGEIPSFRLEKRVIRKDGTVIWTDLAASVVRAADGTPLYGLGMVQDITDRKRTEQALRDSEQRYRDFIKHSNEGVWRLEMEQPIPVDMPAEEAVRRVLQYGSIAECNEAFAHNLGFSAAGDVVGKRIEELLPVSDEERLATLRAAARGGWQGRTVEFRGRDKAGNFKHLLRTEIPIVRNGMLVRVWGITRDITELRQAEEQLRKSEERWRAVFENSAVGIALTDCTSTQFQAANLAFQKMVGYPEDELRASTFMDITYEGDRETNRQLLSELLEGSRQSFALEKRYRRKDGSLLWVNLHVSLVPGTESIPRFSLAIVEDVTERKKAEEALRESEARLRMVVSQLPAIVWSTDKELRFTSHLGAGLRALGVESNQLVGKSVEDFVLSLGPRPHRPDNRPALAGESLSYELLIQGRYYEVHVEPFRSAVGEISGTVGIALDITDRKRAEEALRDSQALTNAIVDSTSDMIWSVDAENFGLLTFNRALSDYFHQWCGIRLQTGTRPEEHFPTEGLVNRWRGFYQRALSEGSYSTEYNVTAGSSILQLTFNLLKRDGKVFGISVFGKNITERRHAEEALRESEERFRTTFENAGVGMALVDLQGHPVKSNPTLRQMLRYGEEELSRMAFTEFTHPDDRELDWRLYNELIAGKRDKYEIEKRYLKKDGSVVWGLLIVSLVKDRDGRPVYAIGMVQDITERKRTEDSLRESEERFRTTFENAGIGIALVDMQGRCIKCNPALRKMLGYGEEVLSRMAFTEYTHPDDRERDWGLYSDLAAGKRDKYEIEARYIKKDGQVMWGLLTVSLVKNMDGLPEYAVGMVEDITERKRAEEELQRSFHQLRALAARLQNVREEERQEVAREIHDQLGQALTAIKIDLSSLVRELPAKLEQPTKRASSIFKLVDETIQAVRRISSELRPGILDDLGLVATIEWAGEEFEARTGTKCRLDLPREDIAIDPERATAIFRIFQETLTNVARHAEASEVKVRLAKEGGDLTLEVRDNGKGLAEERLSSGRSLGILGMRERALLLGGELAIRGAPGKGTTVRVRIPQMTPDKAGVAL